jgi:hypothetical protein
MPKKSIILSNGCVIRPAPVPGVYFIVLVLACICLAPAPAARAVTPDQITEENAETPSLLLVFSDDFSTDPNTNGQWTIHRYDNDPRTEAVWDLREHWHLTRAAGDKGVAVFANYELTATTWRAKFRYRASQLGGLQGGGDGFVFMFYKARHAYGRPGFGAAMGFELSNGSPVAGYGLKFDNYIEGCDPAPSDYFALIKDDVCSFLGGQEDDWVGDNTWHDVEFNFAEGGIRILIDGVATFATHLAEPDYSFSGIGFGAGTGSAVGDYEIDSFRLWVQE